MSPQADAAGEHALDTLRVLLVEDSPDHADLVEAKLRQDVTQLQLQRVETREAFLAALDAGGLDIVLSDFHLPRFSAIEALEALRARSARVPLIVVSGFVGEEATAGLMKAGAADFIAKSNLKRLGGSIRRVLREARSVEDREAALHALAASESRFKALVANLPGVVFRCEITPEGPLLWDFLSESCEPVIGIAAEELRAEPARLIDAIAREHRPGFLAACRATCEQGLPLLWQGRVHAGAEGKIRWLDLRATSAARATGRAIVDGIIDDITPRKLAEDELLRSREQLRELTQHLDRAKEQERAGIAREIHDELGVLLTAAKIEVATLARALPAADLESRTGSLDSLIDQAMDISRRISRRLRPAILDYGVVAAIEWQARDFAKRYGVSCELDAAIEDVGLDPERATAVFRIFQEALTNIARHAGAHGVRVELVEEREGELMLRIADDGHGIAPGEADKPGSFGLRSMRERAHGLGGRLDIVSSAQRGTEVTLRVPLARRADRPAGLAALHG